MIFDFIPYSLNTDMLDFNDKIEYISSDNGVDLYKAKSGLKPSVLGCQATDANLYFCEGTLITVYIRLKASVSETDKTKQVLDKAISRSGKIMETDTCLMYYWQNESRFLGLLVEDGKGFLLLYHSLNRYNIFNT